MLKVNVDSRVTKEIYKSLNRGGKQNKKRLPICTRHSKSSLLVVQLLWQLYLLQNKNLCDVIEECLWREQLDFFFRFKPSGCATQKTQRSFQLFMVVHPECKECGFCIFTFYILVVTVVSCISITSGTYKVWLVLVIFLSWDIPSITFFCV